MIPSVNVEIDKYGRSFNVNIVDKIPPELSAWIMQKLNDRFVGISVDEGVKYSIELYVVSQFNRLVEARYIRHAIDRWMLLRPLFRWRKE